MVRKGVGFNPKYEDDWTLLHHAAKNGLAEVAKVILANDNVDVNARTNHQWTALHYAARFGHAGTAWAQQVH